MFSFGALVALEEVTLFLVHIVQPFVISQCSFCEDLMRCFQLGLQLVSGWVTVAAKPGGMMCQSECWLGGKALCQGGSGATPRAGAGSSIACWPSILVRVSMERDGVLGEVLLKGLC
jgi:hypothetical protein